MEIYEEWRIMFDFNWCCQDETIMTMLITISIQVMNFKKVFKVSSDDTEKRWRWPIIFTILCAMIETFEIVIHQQKSYLPSLSEFLIFNFFF